MPSIHRRGQNAEQSRTADIFFISSVFFVLALIFAVVAYKGFRHAKLKRQSSLGAGRCPARLDLDSLLSSDDHQQPTEISLVGVWMSEDINPKLIHRVPLREADPKTLERFTDSQGFLYVFSDPELSNDVVSLAASPPPGPPPILIPSVPIPTKVWGPMPDRLNFHGTDMKHQ